MSVRSRWWVTIYMADASCFSLSPVYVRSKQRLYMLHNNTLYIHGITS